MKSYLLIILLSFSFLLSCRITKTTLSQTETTAATSVAKVDETATHSEVSEKDISSTGNSITNDSTEITVVETKFSVPDSTGRQFTTSTVTTVINKKVKKTEVTATKSSEQTEINDSASSHSSDSLAVNSNRQTDVEETKTAFPFPLKWLSVLPFVLAAFFIYRFLRRFGAFK